MNAIFLTQSGSLRLFHQVAKELRGRGDLQRVGFYLASRSYFESYRREDPTIEATDHVLLREWEILEEARSRPADPERLRAAEKILGDPTLWAMVAADRRLYFGPRSAYSYDLRPRFSHEQLMAIVQHAIERMNAFFDEVQPDFVASFICVTFGEYLAYLIARSRGIPLLNLRPTRIQNFVHYGASVREPPERVKAEIEAYQRRGIPAGREAAARDYLAAVRATHGVYEGVAIPPTRRRSAPRRLARLALNGGRAAALDIIRWRKGFGDNHDPSHLQAFYFQSLVNPRRARKARRRFASRTLDASALRDTEYVLFPLHTEPEVTLLVHSRPYLQQIELVRLLAQSVPLTTTVLVKEHPASIGKRPISYYEQLLEIPNVRLCAPDADTRTVISHAKMVATVAGSVGWEAAVLGKPVLLLGHAPYELLPSHLVRRVDDFRDCPSQTNELLRSYRPDEEALVRYVAAIMATSAQVNLYSTLLGRDGVFKIPDANVPEAESEAHEIRRLADYTLASYHAAKGVRKSLAPSNATRRPTVLPIPV